MRRRPKAAALVEAKCEEIFLNYLKETNLQPLLMAPMNLKSIKTLMTMENRIYR